MDKNKTNTDPFTVELRLAFIDTAGRLDMTQTKKLRKLFEVMTAKVIEMQDTYAMQEATRFAEWVIDNWSGRADGMWIMGDNEYTTDDLYQIFKSQSHK